MFKDEEFIQLPPVQPSVITPAAAIPKEAVSNLQRVLCHLTGRALPWAAVPCHVHHRTRHKPCCHPDRNVGWTLVISKLLPSPQLYKSRGGSQRPALVERLITLQAEPSFYVLNANSSHMLCSLHRLLMSGNTSRKAIKVLEKYT